MLWRYACSTLGRAESEKEGQYPPRILLPDARAAEQPRRGLTSALQTCFFSLCLEVVACLLLLLLRTSYLLSDRATFTYLDITSLNTYNSSRPAAVGGTSHPTPSDAAVTLVSLQVPPYPAFLAQPCSFEPASTPHHHRTAKHDTCRTTPISSLLGSSSLASASASGKHQHRSPTLLVVVTRCCDSARSRHSHHHLTPSRTHHTWL